MKKTLLFSVIALLMVVLAVGIFSTTAHAETEGYLTYTVTDGKATITGYPTNLYGGLTIPSTLGGYPVTSIGDKGFYYNLGLSSVIIPDSVTSIGNKAFMYCERLTSITIPDSVISIGDEAFSGCSRLPSIEIPNSVTSIGKYAFFNCHSLKSIEIPNSVTSIGNCTFQNCESLTSITIPNSVTNIGNWLFCNCESLTSIKIPNSVTSFGDGVFYGCTSLTTVYYEGTEEEWNKIIIGSDNEPLLNAEIIFAQKNPIEEAVEGTELTIGTIGEKTVIIVPTVSGNVAMTESDLAEMLGDDITIISNNGIIGTGSKIIIGEQEVEIAVKGDIDGDGIATVYDALMVKKALAENSFNENDIREFAGDVDGAGVTDTADVDAILAHIVGEMLIA